MNGAAGSISSIVWKKARWCTPVALELGRKEEAGGSDYQRDLWLHIERSGQCEIHESYLKNKLVSIAPAMEVLSLTGRGETKLAPKDFLRKLPVEHGLRRQVRAWKQEAWTERGDDPLRLKLSGTQRSECAWVFIKFKDNVQQHMSQKLEYGN